MLVRNLNNLKVTTHMSFDSTSINTGEGRKSTRHVGEVPLVLEDVLCLGPDPVDLGPIGQVRLVAHQECQR